MFGGTFVPMYCFFMVLRQEPALGIDDTEAELGKRPTLLGDCNLQSFRLDVVLRDAQAEAVEPGKLEHGTQIALVGGFSIPACRFGVIL